MYKNNLFFSYEQRLALELIPALHLIIFTIKTNLK